MLAMVQSTLLGERKMNVWHDISHERIATKSFEVFIEISSF